MRVIGVRNHQERRRNSRRERGNIHRFRVVVKNRLSTFGTISTVVGRVVYNGISTQD